MQKQEMIERWLHKRFTDYDKRQQAKDFSGKKKLTIHLSQFAAYLTRIIKQNPIVGEYVNDIYNSWKDIMRLYDFFMTSRGNPFDKSKTLADTRFYTRDNVASTTLAEHISLNEEICFDD